MTLQDITFMIMDTIETQGKNSSLCIPGVGFVLIEGKIQNDVLDNFKREQEEYKIQQEYRKC